VFVSPIPIAFYAFNVWAGRNLNSCSEEDFSNGIKDTFYEALLCHLSCALLPFV
jgi:hypothetical protein